MNDPRLERYLSTLENSLRPFPVGDRAEIITEIRSHVLSALDRDPTTRLDSVLAALGEPEMVANRYLLERGLKPTKPPISPIVKWLVIGFLTTFAMMLVFIAFLISRVSGSFEVSDSGVKAFNGMIDVDAKNNRISIHGISAGDQFGGSDPATDKIKLVFGDGDVEISTAEGNEMTWSCRGTGAAPNPKVVADLTTVDFSQVKDSRCEIGIPANRHLEVRAAKGKVELNEPRFHVKAHLESGKMEFSDAEGAAYSFVTSVRSGKSDEFRQSDKKNAYTAELHVDRGILSHEQE